MEAVAASYDARVEELDGLVAEHEQVKSDERRIHVGLKLSARKRRGGKDQHCTAIIRAARRLRTDLRDAAAWHGARAAELSR